MLLNILRKVLYVGGSNRIAISNSKVLLDIDDLYLNNSKNTNTSLHIRWATLAF